MRKYFDEKETELMAVICNSCKKELLVENGILKEGCFFVDNGFGYFSSRDGEIHRFDLCEDCYNDMIAKFQIPVQIEERREYL